MVNSVTSRKFVSCTNCAIQVQPEAKFCGECGSAMIGSTGANHSHAPRIPAQVSYDDLAKLEAFRLAQIQGAQSQWRPTPTGNAAAATNSGHAQAGAAMNFASVGPKIRRVSKALINEMHFLQASLIRERVFLLIHISIYVLANCFGLYLALMCYHGYHGGDEVTKMLMALTPLTFINAVALSCFAPINGTRREINRIKERMQHVKVQMEIGDMF